ncbi:hypothetical protein [Clostridium sp. SM-530-WT-3G]|uniref:hypothetical protein n=1 Tax=Clostridium sp. SM-530-WT-3G TaxID=2725303 RepID=UPI00145DF5AA|nr:hypothetical protein [Clostridium sp. SM-530-WT-3G]
MVVYSQKKLIIIYIKNIEHKNSKDKPKLSKMQIILLLKYIDEYGFNKPWHEEFLKYINCMPEEDINYINSIKGKINLL